MREEATKEGRGAGERRSPCTLEAKLDRLEALDPEGLAAAWKSQFGAPPSALPPRILGLALAYDLQAGTLGDLGPAAERRLARVAQAPEPGEKRRHPSLRLKPGATLMRDWGGRTWRVQVEANGAFSFEGKRWRSLSAIARAITGTSRNGPAFFGLRGGGSHGSA